MRVVRDVPGPSQEQHAMPIQGRVARDVLEDVTLYDSWVRLSEAQQYVPPEPYTTTELMQLYPIRQAILTPIKVTSNKLKKVLILS